MVGAGRLGLGGYSYGGLRGELDRERGGRVRDGEGYRDRINRWEDNAANVILGTEPNAPLAYATGLDTHHLIMSTLGGHRVWLYR